MDADHDKQSELQRMLAAKKPVAPPQRVLKGFSESVIDRLQKPEQPEELTLREQMAQLMESKPVLVCLAGLTVFGCLAAGLVASLRVSPPKPDITAANQEDKLVVAPAPARAAKPVLTPQQPAAVLPAIDRPAVASEPFPYSGSRFQPARPTPTSATPASSDSGDK
jgi:hypothetical protein